MKEIPSLLRALSLSEMAKRSDELTVQAGSEGWSHEQYLRVLCELELDRRTQRRTERLLKEARLPDGKTMATLDQERLPLKLRRQLPSLLEGRFVKDAGNILAFGLPGRGKTHLLCALAHELILRHGCRVLFLQTVHLVQQLLIAKRDLKLESFLRKLDHFDVVLLDDIGYVQQSREEMEVLFTFLSERYERKSIMITSNLLFSDWDKIFKDPMTTAAAIDRLVHHSTILELDGDSHRMRQAKENKKKGD
jgi:DNA replication protein DnaC